MKINAAKESSGTEKTIFADYPVGKALAAMVLPTIVSQIIFVIYNLADTWYVGLTNNADAVAAVSLCLPVYTILSAVSNLFGIGGASVLARALGAGNREKAKRAFAVSLRGAVVFAVIYALIILAVSKPLLLLIGGDSGDIDFAMSYTLWTVVLGGVPTILASACGHLIRASGHPKAASFGMIFGAGLNICLDPLFMFVLLPGGNEVLGAAMATALSNAIGLLYYIIYMIRNRQNNVYCIVPPASAKDFRCAGEIVRDGIPGFLMVAMAMFSNCFLNGMLSSLGSAAVAGVGIVRKIDQLAYAVNQGITQGMLPLVAYCYSAHNHARMRKVILYSAVCSEGFSILCTVCSLLFAPQMVSVFIRDADTIRYGAEFLRVICISIPIYVLTFIVITVFQASGRGKEAFLLSVLRKGTIDIGLMFFISGQFGVSKITWASPVSEAVAMLLSLGMLFVFLKKNADNKTAL